MMRERDIERRVCALARAKGWSVFKWVSPSRRGVPDRIFVRDGRVVFVEFKAPGGRARPLQDHVRTELLRQRAVCHVVDSVEGGCVALAL